MWEKVTDDANKIGRVSAIRDFQSLTMKIFFCDRGFLNRAMQRQFPLGKKFVSATWFSSTNAKMKKKVWKKNIPIEMLMGPLRAYYPFKGERPPKEGPSSLEKMC